MCGTFDCSITLLYLSIFLVISAVKPVVHHISHELFSKVKFIGLKLFNRLNPLSIILSFFYFGCTKPAPKFNYLNAAMSSSMSW